MPQVLPYNRENAVAYAHQWAFGRNPRYDDFEALGGDCTNFISQCLLAGGGRMNFEPVYGWYYVNLNRRSASWTGVEYLYNFLTRTKATTGPFVTKTEISEMVPGDIIQLRFDGAAFTHSLLVVAVSEPVPSGILISTHTYDSDIRALDTYYYTEARFLHIEGVRG